MIKLFTIFGISIEMHISFLILPLIFGFAAGIKGVVLILGVFTLVTLHELCHSLVARRFGVRVQKIVLLPVGGVASMGSLPEKPSQELKIALAGPLFNITLAAILTYPTYYLLGHTIFFSMNVSSWLNVVAYLYWLNIILAIFNLMPAFPMDGGRALRAILAMMMPFQKATKIAVSLGYAFLFLFAAWGIMYRNFWLVIIALFLYIGATQEASQVDIKETLKKLKVKDILPEKFISVTSDTKLSKILEMIFHSHQEDFAVIDNGILVGILTRADIISAVHQHGVEKAAGEIMIKSFPSASPSDSLTKVHRIMEESQLKAIPIKEAGRFLGLISTEDIARIYALMSAREEAR